MVTSSRSTIRRAKSLIGNTNLEHSDSYVVGGDAAYHSSYESDDGNKSCNTSYIGGDTPPYRTLG